MAQLNYKLMYPDLRSGLQIGSPYRAEFPYQDWSYYHACILKHYTK